MPLSILYHKRLGDDLCKYLEDIVGSRAPKIIEKFLDMPLTQIKIILKDWNLFKARAIEVIKLIEKTPIEQRYLNEC